jgi:hypothetical protein
MIPVEAYRKSVIWGMGRSLGLDTLDADQESQTVHAEDPGLAWFQQSSQYYVRR